MKRSDVNRAIVWAKEVLAANNITLPEMAYWTPEQWEANQDKLDTVRKVGLGWDVTDFALDDFDHIGGVLYTVRNGLADDPTVGVPYCEKYIIMKEGQILPDHYHVFKTEDIINRAGGDLEVFLWNADPVTGERLKTDVHAFMDGIEHIVPAGSSVIVKCGCSISLKPYMAHIFGPAKGTKALVVGEVSKVNDDKTDNFFLNSPGRFSSIEEDEPKLAPLCNEY